MRLGRAHMGRALRPGGSYVTATVGPGACPSRTPGHSAALWAEAPRLPLPHGPPHLSSPGDQSFVATASVPSVEIEPVSPIRLPPCDQRPVTSNPDPFIRTKANHVYEHRLQETRALSRPCLSPPRDQTFPPPLGPPPGTENTVTCIHVPQQTKSPRPQDAAQPSGWQGPACSIHPFSVFHTLQGPVATIKL